MPFVKSDGDESLQLNNSHSNLFLQFNLYNALFKFIGTLCCCFVLY